MNKGKIISLSKALSVLSSHKKKKETIVLVGGCFDILHFGHTQYLKESKKLGDILVVIVESDQKVKLLKGKNRPIFKQKERMEVLSAISYINYIIPLPKFMKNDDYFKLLKKINPDIIAVNEKDPYLAKKERQAQKVKAKLEIVPFIKTFSSSELVNKLLEIK